MHMHSRAAAAAAAATSLRLRLRKRTCRHCLLFKCRSKNFILSFVFW